MLSMLNIHSWLKVVVRPNYAYWMVFTTHIHVLWASFGWQHRGFNVFSAWQASAYSLWCSSVRSLGILHMRSTSHLGCKYSPLLQHVCKSDTYCAMRYQHSPVCCQIYFSNIIILIQMKITGLSTLYNI